MLRDKKIFGIAAFDMLVTVLASFILAKTIKSIHETGIFMLTFIIFILLILFAIWLHYTINIPTMLNYYLGINTLDDVIEGRKKRGELI